MKENHEHIKKVGEKNLTFYNPSLLKLGLLTVLTLGVYALYWSYRNWQLIQKAEGSNIKPFWRAVFTIIFIFPLAKRISYSATHHGKDNVISYLIPATLFGLFSLFKEHSFILALLAVLPLLYLQHLATYSNSKHGVHENSGWSKRAQMWAILGGLIIVMGLTFGMHHSGWMWHDRWMNDERGMMDQRDLMGQGDAQNRFYSHSF